MNVSIAKPHHAARQPRVPFNKLHSPKIFFRQHWLHVGKLFIVTIEIVEATKNPELNLIQFLPTISYCRCATAQAVIARIGVTLGCS